MTAGEITQAEKTKLYAKPVFVQGVLQETLRELTAPCDVVVGGVTLRLPAGCVIAVGGGGSGGTVGSLMCDVDFVARNGQTYRATKGMALLIRAA